MKLPESKPLAVIILVAVLTLLAQIPGITRWIEQATVQAPHLVTLAEGIVGIILLIIATSKQGYEQKTPQPQTGAHK
jgi:hypothetical protein